MKNTLSRQCRLPVWGVVVVIIVVLMLAGLGFSYGFEQKRLAVKVQSLALSYLSTQERNQGNSVDAILLALKEMAVAEDHGLQASQHADAEAALYAAVVNNKELATLEGHKGRVNDALFTTNGRRIVTLGEDHSVRVWLSQTGQSLVVLKGHSGDVVSARFSPGGQSLLTTSADKTAIIWDVITQEKITVLAGHDATVSASAFHPNLPVVVTASQDKTVKVWQRDTGQLIKTVGPFKDRVSDVQFSSNGLELLIVAWEQVHVYSTENYGLQYALSGHERGVFHAAYDASGKYIVTASYDG